MMNEKFNEIEKRGFNIEILPNGYFKTIHKTSKKIRTFTTFNLMYNDLSGVCNINCKESKN